MLLRLGFCDQNSAMTTRSRYVAPCHVATYSVASCCHCFLIVAALPTTCVQRVLSLKQLVLLLLRTNIDTKPCLRRAREKVSGFFFPSFPLAAAVSRRFPCVPEKKARKNSHSRGRDSMMMTSYIRPAPLFARTVHSSSSVLLHNKYIPVPSSTRTLN